ncbi:MAG: hypothetical protein HeimC3_53840 [Candidatus Heimdallarchaeota archaeon LC_3]|nr:MAG: hypothetical protein HeimC3_53840 [Candidatus Heimdallarchaeota archaeon LC_3]
MIVEQDLETFLILEINQEPEEMMVVGEENEAMPEKNVIDS